MSNWIIVIPTVRPPSLVAETLMKTYASLTQPTDFLVADGRKGKSATLNDWLETSRMSFENIWGVARSTFYATIDDDVILPLGWQDDLEQAFWDVPKLKCAGVLYSGQEGSDYMRESHPVEMYYGTKFHPIVCGNVAGACMVMKLDTAIEVGPYLWSAHTKHQYDEDGWRCKRIRELGGRMGYVECKNGGAIFRHIQDTPEYVAQKKADTEFLKKANSKLFE